MDVGTLLIGLVMEAGLVVMDHLVGFLLGIWIGEEGN